MSAVRKKPGTRKKAPDPATISRELCALAKDGKLPQRVVLLSPVRGEEEAWFPEQVLNAARAWARSREDLDVLECDGGSPDFDPAALEAFLAAPGLFGGERVLIFSRAGKALKKTLRLGKALAQAEGLVLCLVEACGVKASPPLKELTTAPGARVERFRKLYSDPPPWRPHDLDASEAAQFLSFEARQKGMHFEPGAAGSLVQIAGGRPMELIQSLEHLFLLGLDRISEAQIREVVAHTAEGSAFEFAEALICGDGRKAFSCLQHLRNRGLRSWDGKRLAARDAFSLMLAVLAKQRMQTAAIHSQLSLGVEYAAAFKEAGVPSAGPIAQRMKTRLERVDQEHLDRILKALLEAESNVKQNGWSDSLHALEMLAMRCHRTPQRGRAS